MGRLYHSFVAEIDRLVALHKISVVEAPVVKLGTEPKPLNPALEDDRVDVIQDTARDIAHANKNLPLLDHSTKTRLLRGLDKDPGMSDYEKLVTFLHVLFNDISFVQYYSKISTAEKTRAWVIAHETDLVNQFKTSIDTMLEWDQRGQLEFSFRTIKDQVIKSLRQAPGRRKMQPRYGQRKFEKVAIPTPIGGQPGYKR